MSRTLHSTDLTLPMAGALAAGTFLLVTVTVMVTVMFGVAVAGTARAQDAEAPPSESSTAPATAVPGDDQPEASVARRQRTESQARADADARAYYLLGDELYANGRYEGAEQAFAEAYRLSPRPLLLFNLANAQERSGRWERAVESLRAYRERAPEAELQALDTRIAALERRIDERDALQREEPVVVVQHDRVEMNPPEALSRESSSESPRRPIRPHRILLPVASAFLVTTVALAFATRSARDEVRERCPNVSGGRWCMPGAGSALDRDRRLSILTDVSGALTLGAAAVGVWMMVRHRRERDAEATPAPAFEVSALRHGAFAGVRGGF